VTPRFPRPLRPGYPGPSKSGGLCSGANVPGGQRDAQVWSLRTGSKGGPLTSGRILLHLPARLDVSATSIAW
jgi:hypothetical protein